MHSAETLREETKGEAVLKQGGRRGAGGPSTEGTVNRRAHHESTEKQRSSNGKEGGIRITTLKILAKYL